MNHHKRYLQNKSSEIGRTDRGGRDDVVPEQLHQFAVTLKVENNDNVCGSFSCSDLVLWVLSGSYFSTAEELQVTFSHRIKG